MPTQFGAFPDVGVLGLVLNATGTRTSTRTRTRMYPTRKPGGFSKPLTITTHKWGLETKSNVPQANYRQL
jgi:hypothetical protein